MIRRLLATTAFATVVATGAFAQTSTTTTQPMATPSPTITGQAVAPNGHLASNLIGEKVYNGTADNAEHIGDVNDLVIGQDGKVSQIIVGVGGFLGLGEKNVAIDFATADWAERDGDRWLVVPMSSDQLKTQQAFDRSAYNPAPAATARNTTTVPNGSTAMAPATGTNTMGMGTTAMAPADNNTAATTDRTQTAAIDRSSLKPLNTTDLRAQELVGTTVYGANDENVGEIGDVALAADGKVDAIIVDVGGFLGIGEKEVAVGLDNLSFLTDANGNNYLYSKFTKEQLEAQPAYAKDTYMTQRDQQRLVVPN